MAGRKRAPLRSNSHKIGPTSINHVGKYLIAELNGCILLHNPKDEHANVALSN